MADRAAYRRSLSILDSIAQAGDQKRDAEAMRESAMQDIAKYASEAHQAGVSIADICRAADLSRNTIYVMLGMR